MIYQVVVALSVVVVACGTLFTDDVQQQKAMWETFKKNYNRSYPTMAEEVKRFSHFVENLKLADHRNEEDQRMGGTAVHGITKFADRSPLEQHSRRLNVDLQKHQQPEAHNKRPDNEAKQSMTPMSLVDWTSTHTTPVNDEGYCGGSYAFAATEQIESDFMRTYNKLYTLSVEQILDLDKNDNGCNGGSIEHAFKYVESVSGLVQASNCPFTAGTSGNTGTCHYKSSQAVAAVKSYHSVEKNDASSLEASMASYVQTTGTLAVCLASDTWSTYTRGVLSSCGSAVDVCAQIVGVDTSANPPYWKVRASWGTGFGESGYIRIKYGENLCHITNDPTYVNVAKP